MRRELQPVERNSLRSTGSEVDRKYWVALALYAALAVLAWFTVGEGAILVKGRPVELRLLPLIIIGGLALRTVLARHAEKIRRGGDGGGGTTPRSL
ncbi:MAG: hypothetical protein ABSC77_13635 [Terracidiphilus sp.]|jgi:hypothetical protein